MAKKIREQALDVLRRAKHALWSRVFHLARLTDHKHRIFYSTTETTGRQAMNIRAAAQALTVAWNHTYGYEYEDHVLVTLMCRYPGEEVVDIAMREVCAFFTTTTSAQQQPTR